MADHERDFDNPGLLATLHALSDAQLDELGFGTIGFDADGIVRQYNATESRFSRLSRERVVSLPLFASVAPCMNNFLVAQRFEDAAATSEPLDVTLPYVLTFRMKPVSVVLRLLAAPGPRLRYVLVRDPS
jgi:photoactive yellow protein